MPHSEDATHAAELIDKIPGGTFATDVVIYLILFFVVVVPFLKKVGEGSETTKAFLQKWLGFTPKEEKPVPERRDNAITAPMLEELFNGFAEQQKEHIDARFLAHERNATNTIHEAMESHQEAVLGQVQSNQQVVMQSVNNVKEVLTDKIGSLKENFDAQQLNITKLFERDEKKGNRLTVVETILKETGQS